MPRRSGDQGAKPFELRTGVGGLPTLGGMFRSGDPVTIPPHKFHLLVNMRRTPGGAITRPGLILEFDTGIQECIDGLTEDAGLHGGALMLYPGADWRPPNGGNPPFVPATFRAVFPDSSIDFSEFAIALYGPASATRSVLGGPFADNPVLAYAGRVSFQQPTPVYLSRPFNFRGQAVQFAMVDRNGVDTVALLGIELAQRSFLQASDCWRDTSRPNDGSTPTCPGAAGQPTPPATSIPPLWPFQHPVGSVGVLAYFDNPFTTGDWKPDCASFADDKVIDLLLTMVERVDNILTGQAGAAEVLYFVAVQDDAGTLKRKLVKWDGAQQTTEYGTIPDDVRPGLTQQAYGPILGSADEDGGLGDWAAYRNDAGAWVVTPGLGWIIGPAVADYTEVAFHRRAVSWGGGGHLVVYGEWRCADVTFGDFVHLHQSNGALGFTSAPGARSCTPVHTCERNERLIPVDTVVLGQYCYVLLVLGDYFLAVGSFQDPLVPVTPDGSVRLTGLAPATTVDVPSLWIQVVGERAYIGGWFTDWNPETAAPDVEHHGVYDVTNPAAIFSVYRVERTEQLEDSGAGGLQDERYSRGALTAVPNDDSGGEGFQGS